MMLLFSWLYLFSKIVSETKKLNLQSSPNIIGSTGMYALMAGLLCIVLLPFAAAEEMVYFELPCLSTLFIVIIAIVLETQCDFPVKTTSERETMKFHWETAVDCEVKGDFNKALALFRDLKQPLQIERLQWFILEYSYVIIRRRIIDLEAKGANCDSLWKILEEIANSFEGKQDITVAEQSSAVTGILSGSSDEEPEEMEEEPEEMEEEPEEMEEEPEEIEEEPEEVDEDTSIKDAMEILLSKYPDAVIDLDPNKTKSKK
jgi:hypothetical protein